MLPRRPRTGRPPPRAPADGLRRRTLESGVAPRNGPERGRRLGAGLPVFAALPARVLAWINGLVVRANEGPVQSMGASSWVAIGAYLVVVLGWTVWVATKRYAVPAQS